VLEEGSMILKRHLVTLLLSLWVGGYYWMITQLSEFGYYYSIPYQHTYISSFYF
jgi:hypothetical protein